MGGCGMAVRVPVLKVKSSVPGRCGSWQGQALAR
jgi:hypothetical protein